MRSISLYAALFVATSLSRLLSMNLWEQTQAERCLLYALYESFLPVDGIAFFVAAYRPSSSEISRIVRMVLDARRTLTRDIKILDSFHNLSSKVRWSSVSFPINKLKPSSVESLIAMRNEMVKNDTSNILKKYIEESQEKSDSCLLDLSKTFRSSYFSGKPVERLLARAGNRKKSGGIADAGGTLSRTAGIKSENGKKESDKASAAAGEEGSENRDNKVMSAETSEKKKKENEKKATNNDAKNNTVKQKRETKGKDVEERNGDRELVLRIDREYVDMVMSIVSSVKKNSNVARTLELERDMFYRMKIEVPEAASLKVRRALSLGGGVIVPMYLAEMLRKVQANSGEEKIREWVRVLLEPVKELELRSKLLELKEQKALVIEFLESCLRRSDGMLEKAFEARSEILKVAYQTIEERERENLRQEKAVIEMLRLVKGIDMKGKGDDFWFVKYSKDIEERFYEYLVMRTFEAKQRLLSHLV